MALTAQWFIQMAYIGGRWLAVHIDNIAHGLTGHNHIYTAHRAYSINSTLLGHMVIQYYRATHSAVLT
jgi:hypothetical protein